MRRTAQAALAAPAAVVAIAAAYLLGTVHQPPPVRAADTAGTGAVPAGVVVSGLGKTSGTPDVLEVSLGVEVRRADVSAALRDAGGLQQRVHDALRRAGVAEKDLQTSGVSLYQTTDNKGRPAGYTVSEQVTAKLRNLAKAGQTISNAVSAGGNAARLQGVSFDLSDDTALLQKARDAAFADAKSKAQRYATLAGRTLGPVQTISEQVGQNGPSPAMDVAAAAPIRMPISPGTARVDVTVTVRWSLR